MIRINREMVQT
ncbi:hypothetical protein LINGRAPRIM_LOCUS3285 [Linum grandiflorum]